MGCDYYHEAAVDDTINPSNEPGELTLMARVYDSDGNVVDKSGMTVEIPVGGKMYLDRLTDEPIWAR